jgi:hypothetical protein
MNRRHNYMRMFQAFSFLGFFLTTFSTLIPLQGRKTLNDILGETWKGSFEECFKIPYQNLTLITRKYK